VEGRPKEPRKSIALLVAGVVDDPLEDGAKVNILLSARFRESDGISEKSNGMDDCAEGILAVSRMPGSRFSGLGEWWVIKR